jgi:hypothetical protein
MTRGAGGGPMRIPNETCERAPAIDAPPKNIATSSIAVADSFFMVFLQLE